ncbi:NADH-quinone oxidoreductase subunit N [bacterium]|nr:NADH-quinone oxidoreductase subunit N [bacterium]
MEIKIPDINWLMASPIVILSIFGMLTLIFGIAKGRHTKKAVFVALLGTLLALVSNFICLFEFWQKTNSTFSEMLTSDYISTGFNFIFLTVTLLSIFVSHKYVQDENLPENEYYGMMLLSAAGMMLMASTTNLVVVFTGLEVMSIALYILAGIKRNELKSLEAALKYFLLGAFASGFFLYGISMLYGATGTLDLKIMAEIVSKNGTEFPMILMVGITFLIVGFGFKVALAPFHVWTPDVYEGASSPVTGFMSVGAKAAGFAAFMRVFDVALISIKTDWIDVLAVLAILTMVIGNILALQQTNFKRLLAYSSITHAGYLLLGIIAGNELSSQAIMFYLFSYAFMNIGAFAIITLVGNKNEQFVNVTDFTGLAKKKPLLAFLLTIFLFSLAGIPPMAGFFGKYFIFSALIKSGATNLAIIGVLNAVVGVYYYLSPIVLVWMKEPNEVEINDTNPMLKFALIISALGTILIGIFPSQVMSFLFQI